MWKAVAFASALFLAGCDTSSGTNVTADQARQFTVGVSTVSDVESRLGSPSQVSTSSDGTQTIVYQYENSHQDAGNFIPLVGGVVGHVEQQSNRTAFIFNRAGLLQSYTTGTGNSTTAEH